MLISTVARSHERRRCARPERVRDGLTRSGYDVKWSAASGARRESLPPLHFAPFHPSSSRCPRLGRCGGYARARRALQALDIEHQFLEAFTANRWAEWPSRKPSVLFAHFASRLDSIAL